jgi:hypothetical protein
MEWLSYIEKTTESNIELTLQLSCWLTYNPNKKGPFEN